MGEMTKGTLLKKGAEASLFLADWHGRKVIIKARLPKKYRPAELDKKIQSGDYDGVCGGQAGEAGFGRHVGREEAGFVF